MAPVGDFEISRQARPEFEISIYLFIPSLEISKVTATGGKKNTSLTVLTVAALAPS